MNDLMLHKKYVNVRNIICNIPLMATAEEELLEKNAGTAIISSEEFKNVARPQIILPPPWSPSWDLDFPVHSII